MIDSSKRLSFCTAVGALVTLLLVVLFYQSFDLPIAQAAHSLKGTFAITIGKMFSNLASKHVIQTISFLALIAGTVDATLNGLQNRSRAMLLVAFSTMTAMLIGDELKWFFGRFRPPVFFEDGSFGFTWFSGKYMQNSFPSGHTLRIFSLTTAIALLLPRKKYIPIILAVLIGISRVVVGKHYPSDVIFGCFIGTSCAFWAHYFLFLRSKE
ncbi:phosphatase PAP2 family protein [Maridesulfovibrio salexigens]|uniref:Phosphoesterase PA-phosphatase related n=1 Tax=Maridesulfovibrio salexigens (strain ATCC 14822 / DSM 2638 / NCIMB 8403 / VKM B-1763) TaxID=526222 RepID=C6BRV6_MARSD|nr:phosphatase PAP2 family protein [Maridesulfovibrio salexigens]ACS81339.1 phosphoesterase PA-phosphatase related [Maridesulfovibrio salexigens DSM 2638]